MEHKIVPREIQIKRKEPLGIGDISEYLSLDGYEVQTYPPTMENVLKIIEQKPLIPMEFEFPEWIRFFGSGSLGGWYRAHVICAVGVNNDRPSSHLKDILYFEPLAGEIRTKSLESFYNLFADEIVVIMTNSKLN